MNEERALQFSQVLVKIHAAENLKDLRNAALTGAQELDRDHLEQWAGTLSRLEQDARREAAIPPAFTRHDLVAELLWTHVEFCTRRLRGDSDAKPAPFQNAAADNLTKREREVVAHLALGETDAEIARKLGISRKTVSKHVEHVLNKLGVESRTAAVMATCTQRRLS